MRHRISRRLLLPLVLLLLSATVLGAAVPAQGIGVLCPGKACAERLDFGGSFDGVTYE